MVLVKGVFRDPKDIASFFSLNLAFTFHYLILEGGGDKNSFDPTPTCIPKTRNNLKY